MPTPTYTPLANLTLSGTAASVTFSSISQAYRDLVLVFYGNATTFQDFNIRINGDTGANYSQMFMRGNGGATASNGTQSTTIMQCTVSSMLQSANKVQYLVNIMDYSATDKHKAMLVEGTNANVGTETMSGRWASTAAITNISIIASFAAGSTFALYGIAA